VRLELTRKTDLAVKALCALSPDGRIKGARLAERVGTTPGFVAQVVMPLVDRGWIGSVPGPTGGYHLATPLTEITVLDVIEALEGPTITGRCVLDDGPCPHSEICAMHEPWTRARSALMQELAATTLDSMEPVAGRR
jgi:Rrf2 family transcriptional regulator, iron-sulfur cluster assembly transcription factor